MPNLVVLAALVALAVACGLSLSWGMENRTKFDRAERNIQDLRIRIVDTKTDLDALREHFYAIMPLDEPGNPKICKPYTHGRIHYNSPPPNVDPAN